MPRALAGTEDQHRGAGRETCRRFAASCRGTSHFRRMDAHRLHLALGKTGLPPHTPNNPLDKTPQNGWSSWKGVLLMDQRRITCSRAAKPRDADIAAGTYHNIRIKRF